MKNMKSLDEPCVGDVYVVKQINSDSEFVGYPTLARFSMKEYCDWITGDDIWNIKYCTVSKLRASNYTIIERIPVKDVIEFNEDYGLKESYIISMLSSDGLIYTTLFKDTQWCVVSKSPGCGSVNL